MWQNAPMEQNNALLSQDRGRAWHIYTNQKNRNIKEDISTPDNQELCSTPCFYDWTNALFDNKPGQQSQ